jgi:predicted esterase YcpF (UPF0227 family)
VEKMPKILIYCHGYGSSAKTDKVDRMRAAGFEVYAWNINIDPRISIPELERHVDDLLHEKFNQDIDLIFVGTSLGAWYANKLGITYDSKTLLINPLYNPSSTLPKLGVDPELANLYTPMQPTYRDLIVIADDDEHLDFSYLDPGRARLVRFSTGGHRFNGPEFDQALQLL